MGGCYFQNIISQGCVFLCASVVLCLYHICFVLGYIFTCVHASLHNLRTMWAHQSLNWPRMFCLISSWFFKHTHTHTKTHPHPPGWWAISAAWHSQARPWRVGASVCLSRICVWEWWRRWTICLAESGCAWYPLCLGVAALQMFWLFLVLLCFWFPLVCLELEGLRAIHSGTFEEVLAQSLCCAPSIKQSVPFRLSWDHSNTDLQYEASWRRSLGVLQRNTVYCSTFVSLYQWGDLFAAAYI